ncbi:hypothetical protein E3P99_01795 [Wallemia hederae]|uniref:PX domain-containing protein n=1 Tax=Wallemia hederae TaxID=1540922 RepID=A0A4T0FQ88_9BASI|nr:hypothetical protein E3P99_01795 [Wallemia hederae]
MEDLNPFNDDRDESNGDEDRTSNKFSAPFTPEQLGPKSTTHDSVNIEIVDAVRTNEGAKSSYITYIIQSDSQQVARRYSEFESLRQILGRLYPTLIVPPIPSKHTFGEYANKSKEETKIVAQRKRTLQDFLSRVARHPVLGREHFFHKFLSAEISWKHVLNSPPISTLPRNPLHVSSNDPTNDKNVAAYASLPTPSPSQPLRRPDQRFLDSELFTAKFAQHFESSLERVDRRTAKRWSGIANDYAELGAVFNGFSLTETNTLAAALEKIGQAVDSTYISTNAMLNSWEKDFSEPIHIYSQFAGIIKKLLDYRHQKHAQYEMLIDALSAKRDSLTDLERSEQEAQRLDEALSRGLSSTKMLDEPHQEDANNDTNNEDSNNHEDTAPPQSIITDAPSREIKRHKSHLSFLGAISHTLQGIMDTDPEATRRNSIGKTRESIQGLESALEASTYDLSYTSQTIQADLDRFQRQKVADIREMCVSYAQFHSDWAKANVEVWEEAKKEIDLIDTNLNDDEIEEYSHQFDDI